MNKNKEELKQDLENYARTRAEYFLKRLIKNKREDMYFLLNMQTSRHVFIKTQPTSPHLALKTITPNLALEFFVPAHLHSLFHGTTGLDLKNFIIQNHSITLVSKWIKTI